MSSPLVRVGGERGAHVRTRAMEARGNGAGGHAERVGHLVLRHVAERDEEQRVPLTGRQGGERRRQPRPLRVGVRPGDRRRVVQLDGVVTSAAGVCAEPPLFGAPVASQEVGGDPVQPRQRGLRPRRVGAPRRERPQERVRRQLVGDVTPGPPAQVAMHGGEVPVEE
jgi:hypothetical protein